MTLAERLKAALAAIVATKDAITVLTTKDSLDAAETIQLDELTGKLEKQNGDYAVLQRAEKALAVGAQPAGEGGTGVVVLPQQRGIVQAPGIATRGHLQRHRKPDGFDLLVRSAIAAFESYHTHEQVDAIIARRWPNDQAVAETSKLLAYGVVGKAAQNPAMTTVQGWAAELVRESYQAFMDALGPESVVPRIPMQSYEFDGYGKIHIPSRATTYPSDPNLSAAFRAEGAPIRVGGSQTTSKYLTPKSMGVIGTFTRELLKRSTPNIENAIRQWMLEDTAVALDVTFLDAVAGDAIRPAGILNGVAAGDTHASSGNTAQNITTDIMVMLNGLSAHHLGRRPVWIMNQAYAWALTFSRTATGDPAFPGMNTSGNGSLAGIPVIASTTVPADKVVLADAAELAFAGGAPTFEGSTEATIHEDSGAPNANMVTGATVLPINSGTPATPVRSLFQTHSAALKAVWEIDWTVVRPGAVQVLTGVAWGTPPTP
jgi:hypothetical protein